MEPRRRFTLNISTHPGDLAIIGDDWEAARGLLADEGFDGFELYPVGDYAWGRIPPRLILGLHLRSYPILTPFWRGDRRRLLEIFGDEQTIGTFYGGLTREALVEDYRSQLKLAGELGCAYVVFHLAQSEFENIYDWRFPWTWRETVDLYAELLGEIFARTEFTGELLLENLWWPGSFRALEPEEIAYALERIRYPRSGIMLDTGHVLSTNQGIGSEAEGIAYLARTLRGLGGMRRHVRGLHLTRSLSADYVTRSQAEPAPPPAAGSFWDRYSQAIEHVRNIDQHDAFEDPAIAGLFDLVDPAYVTYEFSFASLEEWLRKMRVQRRAMAGIHGPAL